MGLESQETLLREQRGGPGLAKCGVKKALSIVGAGTSVETSPQISTIGA
jgi:hypothetical protein